MKYLYWFVLAVLVLSLGWIIFNANQAGGGDSHTPDTSIPMTFALTSSAFQSGGAIPAKYTCDAGEAVTPPLSIEGAPEGTRSFVLVVEDPDIPQQIKDTNGIDMFDHWVVYSIPAGTTEIKEGEPVGAFGTNGAGEVTYVGPCPPSDMEPLTHRYFFKLYALSGTLQFIKAPTKAEVLAAMQGMVLAEAELMGTYSRSTH